VGKDHLFIYLYTKIEFYISTEFFHGYSVDWLKKMQF